LRGARNPHVLQYVPVAALRAPSLTIARYAFHHKNLFTVATLQSNDFELFGLAQKFSQDRAAIDARWKELQKEAHPDKFAAQGAAAQRVAMQWSVRINEAYQRLKDPLKRASYLCELNGAPVNAENNTAMPASFLMQQIEWREALDEAKTAENIDEIALQTNEFVREQLLKIEQAIDAQSNFKLAVDHVRALMFVERFALEVDARLDQLQQ
jgi:molecular chaperone HscB